MRGFGIDATVPLDVAAEVAVQAESAGYESFWVNGSPPDKALDIIEKASEQTDLDIGVGVFHLPTISAEELVSEIRDRGIPQDRLWLGVGSSRRPGALAEVGGAAEILRSELGSRVVTAAVGPKMTALAGEVADAVIFTWWIASDVGRSRVMLEQGASSVGRATPVVVSYIRCALLPQAAAALAQRADAYGAIPHYQAVFARNEMTAAETVVTGSSRAELLPGIELEEAVLDHPVIRAIPAADTVDAISELLIACAPG